MKPLIYVFYNHATYIGIAVAASSEGDAWDALRKYYLTRDSSNIVEISWSIIINGLAAVPI